MTRIHYRKGIGFEDLSSLLDSIPDAVYIQDVNGRIIETNLAAQEIYGYTREEFS
jgi:PAS domain S-box-containing protein